jgi:hypothetical protein
MRNFKQVLCLAGASAIVLMFFVVLARAAEADCDDAQRKVSLARVVTTDAKLNFIASPGKRTPGCPSTGDACKLKAFLVPGDEVLVNATDGPFVCAIFKSQAGTETRGWLPRAALELAAPEAAPAPKWAGKWRRDRGAEIVLKSAGDEVKVSGTAIWGASDPERVKRGAVHEGELDDSGKPRGQVLAIGYDPDRSGFPPARDAASDGCAARLQLFDRYLMVKDNGKCGGANVSFTGLYVRATPK